MAGGFRYTGGLLDGAMEGFGFVEGVKDLRAQREWNSKVRGREEQKWAREDEERAWQGVNDFVQARTYDPKTGTSDPTRLTFEDLNDLNNQVQDDPRVKQALDEWFTTDEQRAKGLRSELVGFGPAADTKGEIAQGKAVPIVRWLDADGNEVSRGPLTTTRGNGKDAPVQVVNNDEALTGFRQLLASNSPEFREARTQDYNSRLSGRYAGAVYDAQTAQRPTTQPAGTPAGGTGPAGLRRAALNPPAQTEAPAPEAPVEEPAAQAPEGEAARVVQGLEAEIADRKAKLEALQRENLSEYERVMGGGPRGMNETHRNELTAEISQLEGMLEQAQNGLPVDYEPPQEFSAGARGWGERVRAGVDSAAGLAKRMLYDPVQEAGERIGSALGGAADVGGEFVAGLTGEEPTPEAGLTPDELAAKPPSPQPTPPTQLTAEQAQAIRGASTLREKMRLAEEYGVPKAEIEQSVRQAVPGNDPMSRLDRTVALGGTPSAGQTRSAVSAAGRRAGYQPNKEHRNLLVQMASRGLLDGKGIVEAVNTLKNEPKAEFQVDDGGAVHLVSESGDVLRSFGKRLSPKQYVDAKGKGRKDEVELNNKILDHQKQSVEMALGKDNPDIPKMNAGLQILANLGFIPPAGQDNHAVMNKVYGMLKGDVDGWFSMREYDSISEMPPERAAEAMLATNLGLENMSDYETQVKEPVTTAATEAGVSPFQATVGFANLHGQLTRQYGMSPEDAEYVIKGYLARDPARFAQVLASMDAREVARRMALKLQQGQ